MFLLFNLDFTLLVISKLKVRHTQSAVSPSLLIEHSRIMPGFSGSKEDHDHVNATCYLTRPDPQIVR